jgi:hypothetical protein
MRSSSWAALKMPLIFVRVPNLIALDIGNRSISVCFVGLATTQRRLMFGNVICDTTEIIPHAKESLGKVDAALCRTITRRKWQSHNRTQLFIFKGRDAATIMGGISFDVCGCTFDCRRLPIHIPSMINPQRLSMTSVTEMKMTDEEILLIESSKFYWCFWLSNSNSLTKKLGFITRP